MNRTGLVFHIDDTEVQRTVKIALKRLDDLRPAMEVIGEMGVASIEKSFEVGGRPKKWEDLAESTKAERRKMNKWPGDILVRSGELKRISYAAQRDRVLFSSAGVPYAAIHHFGGYAGPGRKVKIPARPYMLLQEEDGVEAAAILSDFVMNTNGGRR